MDFRDLMKNPQEPNKASETREQKSVIQAFPLQEPFEKILFFALDQVAANWDLAFKKQPLDLAPIKQSVEKMLDFLSQENCNVNFFKSYDVPYYLLNVVNVGWFSLLLGMELGFKREKLIELGIASLLHDIGICQIDPAILNKTHKLSFEEYELIRRHPEEGKKIVSTVSGIPPAIVQGVFQEHERENGSGYSEGKRGDQIHEYAQIIGFMDVFEAMTHVRNYQKKIAPSDAVLELLEMKSRWFAEKYFKSFLRVFTFYPMGCYVQLSTDEIGQVIAVDSNFPTRPTVEMMLDKSGVPLSEPVVMKLIEEDLIYVREALTEEKFRLALGEKGA